MRQALRLLHFLSRQERLAIASIFLARIILIGLDLLVLFALGALVGVFSENGNSSVIEKLLGGSPGPLVQNQLSVPVIFFGLTLVGRAVVAITVSYLSNLVFSRIETRISGLVSNFAYSGGLSRTGNYSPGEIHWLVTASSYNATSGLLSAILEISSGLLLTLAVLTLFVLIDGQVAFFVIIYLATVFLIIQGVLHPQLGRVAAKIQAVSILLVQRLREIQGMFRELSVAGKLPVELTQLAKERGDLARFTARQNFFYALPRNILEVFFVIGLVIWFQLVLFSGNVEQSLEVGLVFVTGGFRLIASAVPVQAAIASLRGVLEQSKLAMDALEELDHGKSGLPNPSLDFSPGASSANENSPLSVSCRDLRIRRLDRPAFELDVPLLDIEPGEFLAIIGPSGSGKSTLVDIILGLLTPNSGTVRIGGQPPNQLIENAPGSIGYVPQVPGVFEGTLARNISMSDRLTESDQLKLRRAVQLAGLEGYVSSLPKEFDSEFTGSADFASGGERQRMGIARSLFSNPRLLILDESTNALDAHTEGKVIETLETLRGRTTLMVIAHRLHTIQYADRVLFMKDGRIQAQGKLPYLIQTSEDVRQYVELVKIQSREN